MPSISRIVDRIMTDYDHNADGVISLQAPGGKGFFGKIAAEMRNPDERYRMDDFIPGQMTPLQTWHHIALFEAADANHDQSVTREELTAVVARFDTNGNGSLETRGAAFWKARHEKQLFERQFGEQSDS